MEWFDNWEVIRKWKYIYSQLMYLMEAKPMRVLRLKSATPGRVLHLRDYYG